MLNQPEERSCVSSGLCLAICIRGATGRDRPFLTESQRVGWFGESDTVDSLLWPLERIVKVVEYRDRYARTQTPSTFWHSKSNVDSMVH